MPTTAVRFVMCCGLCLLAACASSPEPADEPEPAAEQSVADQDTAPDLPEYHAESDADRLGYDESKSVARVICGSAPSARECRRTMGRRGVLAYRGAFSEPGADEMIAATDAGAVLLGASGGQWSASARLQDIDIDSCLVVSGTDGKDALVCRVPVSREDGFGLELYAVDVKDDGLLATEALDLPRATDIDAVMFAGWKSVDAGVTVRVHDATEVASAKQTVDMDGAGGCKHVTFAFEPGAGLEKVDACTTAATADQATGQNTAYESRLSDPLMKRNRHYVRCYRDELVRIKEEAEQRQRLTGLCEEGHAPTDVDCSEYLEEDEEGEGDGDAAVVDASKGPDQGAEETPPAELAGQIQTRLVIGSPGAPVACQVIETTMVNEQVETCLCRELMKTEFPPVPEGAFFDVTYPFDFSPDLER